MHGNYLSVFSIGSFLCNYIKFIIFSVYTKGKYIAPNKVELLLWLLLGYKLLHACRHFFLNCFSLFVNEILLWDSVNSSFLIFTDLPMSRKTGFVNLLCLKELFSSIIRIIAWRSFLLLSSVLFSCFFCINWMFFKSKFFRSFFLWET